MVGSVNRNLLQNISGGDSLRSRPTGSERSGLGANIHFVSRSSCGFPGAACSFECPAVSELAFDKFRQTTGINITDHYNSNSGDICERHINDGMVALASFYALLGPQARNKHKLDVMALFRKLELPDSRNKSTVKLFNDKIMALKNEFNLTDHAALDRMCDNYMERFVFPVIKENVASSFSKSGQSDAADNVMRYGASQTKELLHQNLLSNFEDTKQTLKNAIIHSLKNKDQIGSNLAGLFKHLNSCPVLLNSYSSVPANLKNEAAPEVAPAPANPPLSSPPSSLSIPQGNGHGPITINNNNNISLDGLADLLGKVFDLKFKDALQGMSQSTPLAERVNTPGLSATTGVTSVSTQSDPHKVEESSQTESDLGYVSAEDVPDGVEFNSRTSETEPKLQNANDGIEFDSLRKPESNLRALEKTSKSDFPNSDSESSDDKGFGRSSFNRQLTEEEYEPFVSYGDTSTGLDWISNPIYEPKLNSSDMDDDQIVFAQPALVVEEPSFGSPSKTSTKVLNSWELASQIAKPGTGGMQQSEKLVDLLKEFNIDFKLPDNIEKFYKNNQVPLFTLNGNAADLHISKETISAYQDYIANANPTESLYAGIAITIMNQIHDKPANSHGNIGKAVIRETPAETVKAIRETFSNILKNKEREKLDKRVNNRVVLTEEGALRREQSALQRHSQSLFKLDK